ncbi:LysR family transcriptional regulator [Rhizorhabdus dicambivorans]|uniref:LysR family transcriptional regulator n=1 Tax=Rhizorhabdus dicambivorans TaxID=1850238 RepID=A0A2A4FZ82_9SPHN|nr:LysR family transcriptional regulator [Rhizorhabdus dicambivorans]ATE63681.1 LysR family transcriptional regulator [Rhizorhabdus dicambivorans]PCE42809.1 LysR family transcriptional regulator [Rhizorhabdus dicambivorans]
MDLRQLRHFRQIALLGSFSAASGALRIAQPALSRQMQMLERELGVKLFHRTGRGVLLTAAGNALLAESADLLDRADRLGRTIRVFGDRLAGEATIGLSPTIGRMLVLPLAMRVQQDFPDLRLRIAEGFSGTLLEWLQGGRLDAAILYHAPSHRALHSELVAYEPLSIIGGTGDPAFPPGEEVPLAALAGRPLVLSTPSHGLRQMVDRHAAALGVSLDMLFEIDSLDATIALVRQGMALTILPESGVRAELDAGELLAWRIGAPNFERPLVIATAPQRPDAIGARELGALLRGSILSASAACGWRLIER